MDDPKHDSVSMLYPHSHHHNNHRWHLLYLSSSFLFMVMICFCWNISARFTLINTCAHQCIANKTVPIRKAIPFKGTWYKFRYSIRCCRSSHQRCSLEKGVLRNFSKFTGKQQLCQSLLFNKVAGTAVAQLLSCEFWEISKNTFFTEQLWTTAPDAGSSSLQCMQSFNGNQLEASRYPTVKKKILYRTLLIRSKGLFMEA